MARWIWKFGEFECYHNQQIHRKRQAYGHMEPVVWKIFRPEPAVEFKKKVTTDGGWIHIEACGDFSVSLMDVPNERDPQWFGAQDVLLPAGTHVLDIRVMNFETFPAVYVDGIVETDESWTADDLTLHDEKAASDDWFDSREKRPDVFPFQYEPVTGAAKEVLPEGGCLFDFRKETFAKTHVTGLSKKETFRIQFGESREEALDLKWSVTHFDTAADENGQKDFDAVAFRFIYVSDKNAEISAESEYLPMSEVGAYHSDNELMNRIWKTAAYTFHLNCREMFLDGIKRDRWVWAADSYQSLFVNRYLFFDKKIEQRTLIALGGKQRFERHINTIVDYTFFWFMSLKEHYQTYGDLEFIRRMKPQMDVVMNFCRARTDADGFMRGKKGDWIFIDWADNLDREGALAGEQILYAKAMEDYADLCDVLGESDEFGCRQKAEHLQTVISEKFWDKEQKAFIDSYESGKHNVTRQTNILAYLFLPCSDERKEAIYEHVILNDRILPITTPYFEFYENQVHCLSGHSDFLEQSLADYYGGMLKLGATTFYEQYDPKNQGVEHYAMYGRPFEKSLCHAWSASPVYLLGRFRLGVVNTGIAYDHFEVKPNLGTAESIEGKVPVPGGYVSVKADKKKVEVLSDIPGGTLILGDKTFPIKAGIRLSVSL